MSLITDKWDANYFAMVVSLLDRIIESGKALCGVTAEEAKKLKANVMTYSVISPGDAAKPVRDMTIRVRMFFNDHKRVTQVLYHALGGAGDYIDWITPTSEKVEEYCQPLIERAKECAAMTKECRV